MQLTRTILLGGHHPKRKYVYPQFEAIVDVADYEKFGHINWSLLKSKRRHNTQYAYRMIGTTPVFLHRLIVDAPKGLFVDHINGNTLDNRRANLRLCTIAENCRNAKLSKLNTSGYKGVQKKGKRWQASIVSNRCGYYLGMFDTPELAALAYNKKAKELHGDFAYQNQVDTLLPGDVSK